MRQLALGQGTDAELWQLVGLVHDLDYFAVEGDWSRHGLLTREWLAGRLPDDARLVSFHGKVDPWSYRAQQIPWIKTHYPMAVTA